MRLSCRLLRRSLATGLGSVFGTLAGCAGTPDVVEVPEPSLVDWSAAAGAAEDLPVLQLREGGVLGGEIAAIVPAEPSAVAERMLDFDAADGHRAWARHHSVVSRDGDRVVARWDFAGKLGVNPSAEFAFEAERRGEEWVITYRQLESVFGLSSFFGDYRIRPVPERPRHALLIERVFIDSGLPFVGASEADIAEGLREDVKRIRDWCRSATDPEGAIPAEIRSN